MGNILVPPPITTSTTAHSHDVGRKKKTTQKKNPRKHHTFTMLPLITHKKLWCRRGRDQRKLLASVLFFQNEKVLILRFLISVIKDADGVKLLYSSLFWNWPDNISLIAVPRIEFRWNLVMTLFDILPLISSLLKHLLFIPLKGKKRTFKWRHCRRCAADVEYFSIFWHRLCELCALVSMFTLCVRSHVLIT